MKKIRGLAVTLASCLIVMGLLACLLGCGESPKATLEDIAGNNPEVTETIKKELLQPKGMKGEVIFSGDSFDIVYSFVDKRPDGEEKVLVKAMESNGDVLEKSWTEGISQIEKQTGITGIMGTIIVKNASGEEIWTRTFPEK